MELRADLVNLTSPSQAKIALFRSLFRGREDVYPRRFESRKSGKAGYAPACANEWVRGICEKPRIKCAECPNRRFLPVTDDVFEEAIPAALARRLGSHVLTETMEGRPDIGRIRTTASFQVRSRCRRGDSGT
jgi:hypothetical protein